MKDNGTLRVVLLVVVAAGTVFMGQDNKADKEALNRPKTSEFSNRSG